MFGTRTPERQMCTVDVPAACCLAMVHLTGGGIFLAG